MNYTEWPTKRFSRQRKAADLRVIFLGGRMTFEEWWKNSVRPYVPKGSELEQTIFPWVEDAWKAAGRTMMDQDLKSKNNQEFKKD
uniref:Uncharacterized protein n=1 Tax=viral metagenome TaxID=1070528 RepID=A0A6H1ZXE2_9ZZZZ